MIAGIHGLDGVLHTHRVEIATKFWNILSHDGLEMFWWWEHTSVDNTIDDMRIFAKKSPLMRLKHFFSRCVLVRLLDRTVFLHNFISTVKRLVKGYCCGSFRVIHYQKSGRRPL